MCLMLIDCWVKWKIKIIIINEILKNKNILFCDLNGTLIETISGETTKVIDDYNKR